MEVIDVVKDEYWVSSFGTMKVPVTYFLLTPKEQELYDGFRAEHDKLRALPQGGSTTQQNNVISQMFLNVINPYFYEIGLDVRGSFTTFGEERQTMLHLPKYVLSKKEQDFEGNFEPGIWFSTEGEKLSCMSWLNYVSANPWRTNMLYGIIERVFKNKKQDGIEAPFIIPKDSSLHFGSVEHTMSLMQDIGQVVSSIDPKNMHELCVLHDSYAREASRAQDRDSEAEIKRDTFASAYASSLEIALLESGLV